MKSWLSPEYLVRRLAIANDAQRLGILSKTSEVSENLESALLKNFDDQNFWTNLKADITSTNPIDLVTAFMCSKEVLNS